MLQLQQAMEASVDTAAGGGGGGAGSNRLLQQQQQQQLQQPAAILHALSRMSALQLTHLHPSDAAAGWILAQAAVLPGAVQLLMQQWMQQLVAPQDNSVAVCNSGAALIAAPGAAGAQGAQCEGPREQHQQQQELSLQQRELLDALLAAVVQQPAAVSAMLLLLQDVLEIQQSKQQQQQQQQQPQQQQQHGQLAAWLAVLTAVLQQCCAQIDAATALQLQHFRQQQQTVAGACHTESTHAILQLLLFGSSSSGLAMGGTSVAHINSSTGRATSDSNSSMARAVSCLSLLQLSSKAIMTCTATAGWFSSSSSSLLMVACSNCLTAVAAACSNGAAAAVAAAAGAGKQDLERLLLQQGVHQVGFAIASAIAPCTLSWHYSEAVMSNKALGSARGTWPKTVDGKICYWN